MGGIGFLIPLYLVDIKGIQPAELGGMLMIGAGSMAVVVRLAGSPADRWSSRWFVVVGLLGQTGTLFAFSHLPASTSLWHIGLALSAHGLSAGLMLATLHKVVMGRVEQTETGTAAGLYSMCRFRCSHGHGPQRCPTAGPSRRGARPLNGLPTGIWRNRTLPCTWHTDRLQPARGLTPSPIAHTTF